MKKCIIFILITVFFIGIHAETDLSLEDYIKQSETIMKTSKNKIRIFTIYNRSINAEFIGFRNDSLIYFDISNICNELIPLVDIRHIVAKNNKSAFDGDYYIENYCKDNVAQLIDTQNKNFKDRQYNERTVIALEKIAKVQSYFMVYSVVTTLLTIAIIAFSL